MTNEEYKNYILDQMRLVEGISVRRMFGSFGFYADGKFFAILSEDRLYFKTNKKTKNKYEEYGSKPFQPSLKQKLRNYYEVPSEIVEDPSELSAWAREAVEIDKKTN